ncbi:MAG: lipopolysaccharide biosynthesis protein [Sulfuriferula sp.]
MTTALIAVVGFISSVITARVLGPEGRGLLSAALLISSLAANIAQMGLANSYVYHFGAARSYHYLRFFAMSLAFVGITACLLAWGGARLSHEVEIHQQIILIIVLALFMSGQIYFLVLSQLRADLHFFNFLRLSLVLGNLILLLPVVLFFKSVDYQYILITQLMVAIGLTFAGLYWARKNVVWQEKASGPPVSLGRILQYAFNQHGTTMLGIGLANFDKVVLLNMGTIEQYGYYAVAFTTSRLIGSVQDAVSTALFARFAGKDIKELGDKVRTAFRITFLPMLALAALGAVLSPWLIVWVYGKSFAAMALPFSILLFECVIGGASWTLAQRFNAGGRPGLVLIPQLISVAPMLALIPFLPRENTYIYLAALMLCIAIFFLIITMVLYPIMLKEPMPRLLPTIHDYRAIRQLLART